ncbi:MAG: hypothetical protein AAF492_17360, partial [Verrucomicrobiota bacterium]
MKTLLGCIRFIGYMVVTGSLYSLWVIGAPFALGSPTRRKAWRRFIMGNWCRGAGAVLGMKVEVEGTPPKPPY